MDNNAELDNEIEIDLKDLFLEIAAFWRVILVTLILGAVIAYAISKLIMVPQYESTAELYVLTKSTSITSIADIQTGTSLTDDYMVVVKGRPVLEQVIENLGLDETYKTLSKKVSLNNPSNSRILEITVKDEDPYVAKEIADEIAEVGANFISIKMDQDPPTIIQNGYADGDPVSPSTLKNTAIGAALGAVLAIAIVVLSYLFNDTIMTAEDIEKKLSLNILGTLPLEEPEEENGRKAEKKKKKREKKRAKKSKKHANRAKPGRSRRESGL